MREHAQHQTQGAANTDKAEVAKEPDKEGGLFSSFFGLFGSKTDQANFRSSGPQLQGKKEYLPPAAAGTAAAQVAATKTESANIKEEEVNAAGTTATQSIAASDAASRHGPQRRGLDTWSARQVGSWLSSFGLGEYAETFVAQHIDGTVLRMLQRDDLAALGCTVGHRLQILQAIGKLYSGEEPVSAVPGPAVHEMRSSQMSGVSEAEVLGVEVPEVEVAASPSSMGTADEAVHEEVGMMAEREFFTMPLRMEGTNRVCSRADVQTRTPLRFTNASSVREPARKVACARRDYGEMVAAHGSLLALLRGLTAPLILTGISNPEGPADWEALAADWTHDGLLERFPAAKGKVLVKKSRREEMDCNVLRVQGCDIGFASMTMADFLSRPPLGDPGSDGFNYYWHNEQLGDDSIMPLGEGAPRTNNRMWVTRGNSSGNAHWDSGPSIVVLFIGHQAITI